MVNMKKIIKKSLSYIYMFVLRLLSPNTIYILCPGGIGDTILISSLMKSFKKYYSIKRIVLIVKNRNHAEMASLFPSVDKTMIISQRLFSYVVMEKNKLSVEAALNHSHFIYGHFPEKNMMDISSLIKDSFLQSYCYFVLRIPLESPCEEISVLRVEHVEILPNSILLAPYSVTTKHLEIGFWENLSKALTAKGYNVYTNVTYKDPGVIAGTLAYDKTLLMATKDLHHFQYVISNRSGISDLVCFINTSQIVLYNDAFEHKLYRIDNQLSRNTTELIYSGAKTIESICDLLDRNDAVL